MKVKITVLEGAYKGQFLEGFLSVSIHKSLSYLCGTFEIDLTDIWASKGEPYPLAEGDKIQISCENKVQLTGYIEGIVLALNAHNHQVRISGREITCDLVDCTAINVQRGIHNQTLPQIAAKLCEPFGIKVRDKTNFPWQTISLQVSPGQTVFSILEQLAKNHGVLLCTSPLGELEIFVPQSKSSSLPILKEGHNVLSAEYQSRMDQRFSIYTAVTQSKIGPKNLSPKSETQIKGGSKDVYIKRFRPLFITLEKEGKEEDALRRAKWEANSRIAKSKTLKVETNGWFVYDGGPQWEPGMIISISLPSLRFYGEMMIQSVEKTIYSEGTKVALESIRKDSYQENATTAADIDVINKIPIANQYSTNKLEHHIP